MDVWSTALEQLLPRGVAVVSCRGDVDPAVVWASERAAIAQAVPSRQSEYLTVRHCARRALEALGVAPVAIPTGRQRGPVWPDGVVGSLTHCRDYRAAAVARRGDLVGVGIDAEVRARLPLGSERVVTNRLERDRLALLDKLHPEVPWGTLLFSAKESVFKAWYPLTGVWLEFDDCDLELHPDATFRGTIAAAKRSAALGAPSVITGRWSVNVELLFTAAWIPSVS